MADSEYHGPGGLVDSGRQPPSLQRLTRPSDRAVRWVCTGGPHGTGRGACEFYATRARTGHGAGRERFAVGPGSRVGSRVGLTRHIFLSPKSHMNVAEV
jgi:hypothetical protein